MLGYTLSLTCQVNDSPSSLTWYHNDVEVVTGVTINSNQATYEVDPVVLETAGVYKCVVEYAASSSTLGRQGILLINF